MKKIEILSPGGDADSVKAAILAGADAVYTGLKKFNARKRANNLDLPELADLIILAHQKNVKIFVTMNILLTEREIPEAIDFAAELIKIGVDAIIVQDAGFAYLLNKLFPNLEMHASTQMTTHNSLQIDFIKKLGFKQLNFSRELSSNELKPLINYSHNNNLITEIFVHGAYCISCSGICYMSSVIAAQPGNRGACLQPCRRQYNTPGKKDKEYLLSLKDNNALQHSEDIFSLNADTLKIEGRIKGFNYVFQVTNAWRKQIDDIYQDKTYNHQLENQLKNVFNRDFSTGYFQSKISSDMFVNSPLDQSLTNIGKVDNYNADKKVLTFETKVKLKAGDRINIYTNENLFICGIIINKSIDGKSFCVEIENKLKGKILKGQIALLLSNLDESKNIKEQIDLLKPNKFKVNIIVEGKINQKLNVEFSFSNKIIEVFSDSLLTNAEKNSLDIELLKTQLGRLGNTNFEIGEIDISKLDDNLFIPVKELNAIKRQAVSTFSISKPEYIIPQKNLINKPATKKLAILVSEPKDIDLFDGLVFLETTSFTKLSNLNEIKNLWVPPICFETELEYYKNLLTEVKPNFVVSDNIGIGNWCGENNISWIAGPQLNSSNSFSFDAYKEKSFAKGGFYSTEINKDQINDFHQPDNFLTFYNVFGHLLLMTTRQCLFQKPNLCKQNKKQTDSECLNSCSNYTTYNDEVNVPFHIVKSFGHLNRIFNDSILFLPEAILNVKSDYYLIDFRNLPFNKYDRADKLKIIHFFQNIINTNTINPKEEKQIKNLVNKITRGNYNRGFE